TALPPRLTGARPPAAAARPKRRLLRFRERSSLCLGWGSGWGGAVGVRRGPGATISLRRPGAHVNRARGEVLNDVGIRQRMAPPYSRAVLAFQSDVTPTMTVAAFSPGWAQALKAEINKSPVYQQAGKGWNWTVGLVVEAEPDKKFPEAK